MHVPQAKCIQCGIDTGASHWAMCNTCFDAAYLTLKMCGMYDLSFRTSKDTPYFTDSIASMYYHSMSDEE